MLSEIERMTRKRERRAAYYLAHREEEMAAATAYRINNPEKVKKIQDNYRAKNRDKIKIRVRKYHADYYIKNGNSIRRKSSEWRAKNLEKSRARTAAWKLKNSERAKLTNLAWKKTSNGRSSFNSCRAKRRAIKCGAGLGDVAIISKWEKRWRALKRITCYWCGGTFRVKECHTDHIVALSKGGAHSIENLCISCSSCNHRKGGKSVSEWNKAITEPVFL